MSEDALLDEQLDETGGGVAPSGSAASGGSALDAYDDALLPPVLREALKKRGFSDLTSVQRSVVEAKTDERDVRISSQTGSGKTVAVGVAIGRELLRFGSRREQVERGDDVDIRAPQVLLLTPTRELATQVGRELSWLFVSVPDAFVEVVTGGTSVGLERKNLSRGPRVIVGTPGRVLDHLNGGGFSGHQVRQVVLDEADQMLDMGFRDELEGILEKLPEERRTHLVSATFSGDVLAIAQRFQKLPVTLQGSPLGAANSDIEHVAHVVGMRHRYDALINILLSSIARREDDDPGRTLVFTRTRADTLEVAERLQKDGLRAEPLSGDLAQAQRTRTLSAFRSGRVSILVATDVAARGLDVQGVDLVVHFDPPGDPDAYTHRSGRTGRAGRKGTSILLLPPQARGRIERLLRAARVSPSWAPVPSADKVKKLYSKLGKRRLFDSLGEQADPEHVEYAKKLLTEHSAEQIIARLLSYTDVKPPCLPREIGEHISAEYRGNQRAEGRPRRGGDMRREPFRGDGRRDPERGGSARDGGPPRKYGGPSRDAGQSRKYSGPPREQGGSKREFRGPQQERSEGREDFTPRESGAKVRRGPHGENPRPEGKRGAARHKLGGPPKRRFR